MIARMTCSATPTVHLATPAIGRDSGSVHDGAKGYQPSPAVAPEGFAWLSHAIHYFPLHHTTYSPARSNLRPQRPAKAALSSLTGPNRNIPKAAYREIGKYPGQRRVGPACPIEHSRLAHHPPAEPGKAPGPSSGHSKLHHNTGRRQSACQGELTP